MATTIILGDIAEGQKWWGTAEFLKTQLAAIYRQNNSFMHAWKQVSADTKIFCEMRSGTPWAFIYSGDESLYMESGFLSFISAKCNEAVARPATLNYNADITLYMGQYDHPLQGNLRLTPPVGGERILDGSESKAVGCDTKLISFTDSCGTVYEDQTKPYCDYQQMLMKKKCQALIPASMFTAKTRLLVQAIYGSKRTDYTCSWEDPYFDYSLFIGSLRLSPSYVSNTWLLTTDEYEYFIVTFNLSSLTFKKLKLSSGARRLRDLLVKGSVGAADIKKYEAYILSTLTADDDFQEQTVAISGEINNGSPLWSGVYGWHTTWNGRVADTILMEDDGGTKRYNCHHTRISILYDYNEANASFSFTVSAELVKTTYYSPIHSVVNFIVPSITLGCMLNVPLLYPGPSEFVSDCVLHVYYDNDVLQEWGISRDFFYSAGYHEVEYASVPLTTRYEISEYIRIVYSGPSKSYDVGVTFNGENVTPFLHNYTNTTTFRYRGWFDHYDGYSVSFSNYPAADSGPWIAGSLDDATNLQLNEAMAYLGYWENSAGGNGPKCVFTYDEFGTLLSSITYRGVLRTGVRMIERQYRAYPVTYTDTTGCFLEIPFNDCEQVWFGQNASGVSGGDSIGYKEVTMAIDWWIEKVIYVQGVGTRYELEGEIRAMKAYEYTGTYWLDADPPAGYTPWRTDGYHLVQETDGTIVRDVSTESTNFHYVGPVDLTETIPFETWRSSSSGDYYTNNMTFGPDLIAHNVDFSGDSVIGWV